MKQELKGKPMVCGNVLNIQHHSIHDGPGIRSTVFLKGCPLRCVWCCNPESQNFSKDVLFVSGRCIHCGACETVCPAEAITGGKIDRNQCCGCKKCVGECYSGALRMAGQMVTVDEVMEEILKDDRYYEGNGGVTFSGGEAFAQPQFLEELLKRCKAENLHTLIETCGYFNWEACRHAIKAVDMIYFDLKHYDDNGYQAFTGVGIETIRSNLIKLIAAGKNITIRIPVVKGYNGDLSIMKQIGFLLCDCGYKGEVHLLPYHAYGSVKYQQLGKKYQGENAMRPTDEEIRTIMKCLNGQGYQVVCNF